VITEEGISARGVLRVLFKRRRLVTLFLISTVATTVLALVLFFRPTYLATAQLMVTPTGDQGLDASAIPTLGTPSARVTFNLGERTSRSVEILTGTTLAQLVVRSIGADVLYPPAERTSLDVVVDWLGKLSASGPAQAEAREEVAIERLRADLSTQVSLAAGWINVSFRHRDADLAARVVNELCTQYLERYIGVRQNSHSESFVREQLTVLKGTVDRTSQELERFKSRYQINVSPKEDEDLALKQLGTAQSEINATLRSEAETANRAEQIRLQLGRMRDELRSGAGSRKGLGSDSAGLRERLSSLELKEAELAQRYTSEHPSLKATRSEISALRGQLSASASGGAAGAEPGASDEAAYQALKAELLRSEAELSSLRARRELQAPQLTQIQGKVGQINRTAGEFARLQEQAQAAQENYRQYLATAEQLRIGRAMDAERIADVKVIEGARRPLRAEPSKRMLILAISVVMGLAGAVALAFLLELLGARLDTVEAVEAFLKVPVLASIPVFDTNV
jgi:uncharacterized protein involved in exopolysaccharide biosynthesis